ncbi:hypothetical protein SAB0826c [Staphylococcus aureus RF122]|nr:hypothetical protein SAB0826c [Staphylococcus aureus RF122]
MIKYIVDRLIRNSQCWGPPQLALSVEIGSPISLCWGPRLFLK